MVILILLLHYLFPGVTVYFLDAVLQYKILSSLLTGIRNAVFWFAEKLHSFCFKHWVVCKCSDLWDCKKMFYDGSTPSTESANTVFFTRCCWELWFTLSQLQQLMFPFEYHFMFQTIHVCSVLQSIQISTRPVSPSRMNSVSQCK